MNAIEHLTAADHAAVRCHLLDAYAERMGPDAWTRMSDRLAQTAGRLSDAEIAGISRVPASRAAEMGLHTSEAMTMTARGVCERMGFVVDGDLPMNFGLPCWRFRWNPEGG